MGSPLRTEGKVRGHVFSDKIEAQIVDKFEKFESWCLPTWATPKSKQIAAQSNRKHPKSVIFAHSNSDASQTSQSPSTIFFPMVCFGLKPRAKL